MSTGRRKQVWPKFLGRFWARPIYAITSQVGGVKPPTSFKICTVDECPILAVEEGQQPMEVSPWSSSTVCWRFSPAPILASPLGLMAAGHTEDEVRGAWNFARSAGYTEPTGLGRDRLTPAGKARAAEMGI